MPNKTKTMVGVVVVALFLTWLGFHLEAVSISMAPADAVAFSASLVASPTSSFTAISAAPSPSPGGINPTILAALIGLGGVIVGALITGLFALYQQRRTIQIEQQRQTEQHRHEQEMARLLKELEAQYKAKEQEQERNATQAEALRMKMLLAQTNKERATTYQQALHADSRISRLQILDMNRPLEVTNIYVRVRVHQDTRLSYELDPTLRAAEALRDPNALLRASFKNLEQRTSSAIDPAEAIRIYKRCILVGDPGAGKTTLLKYLTLKSASSSLIGLPNLPIRVELNVFAESGYHDLLDFAAADWDEHYGFPRAEARAYMEENLRSGNAILLLDALDEAVIGETMKAAETSYQRVVDAVIRIATRFHQSPVVVTARKAGYHQRMPLVGFTELEVLDFRLEDAQQFVTNWFGCYEDQRKRNRAAELNTKLESNPRILALAANPLLLSLIVLLYEAELNLPERRAELYRRCVETLLVEWDAKRAIRRRREFKSEHKRQLLAEIAWHFHRQGRRYFPENEVLEVIASFLPKIQLPSAQNGQVLAELASEHGLIKEQARGWHGFLHLTLQEYFVAQYATDHQKLEVLLAHRGDPWWEEVLQLYAGYTADASLLLRKLVGGIQEGGLEEDIFSTNLLLAGRCLVARPTIHQAELWKTTIDLLFEALTTTPYSLTRELIAEVLATIGGAEVSERLLELLSNEQLGSQLHLGIAQAVGKLRGSSIASALVPLLSHGKLDPAVRQSIAEALGDLGEPSVAPALVPLLSDEQLAHSVRQEIALALGDLGEPSVAPALVPLLMKRQLNRFVSIGIAEGLCQLGEPSVVPELVPLLSDEQLDLTVRVRIAKALDELRAPSDALPLARLLSDQQLALKEREYLTQTLGHLEAHSIAPTVVQFLSNRGISLLARMRMIELVGDLGDHAVVPELLQLLANQELEPLLQVYTAEILGRLRDRAISPALVQLLSNQRLDLDVGWSVAEAIGNLGEREVAPALAQLLLQRGYGRSTSQRIVLALRKLGESSVVPDLLSLLPNEQLDPFVRSNIAFALADLGKQEIIPALIPFLSNQQIVSSVRASVAWALGNLGEHSLVPELIPLLPNEQLDSEVRRGVAQALEDLVNDEASVHYLADLLLVSDIADDIHRTLYAASRRIGVRIFMRDGPGGKQLEYVKWSTLAVDEL